MVAPMHRSRTMRRIKRKTPGSKVVKRHVLRKPAPAKCQDTGVALQAVPKARPNQLRKLPKTARRPQRPFGGVLSSAAARRRNVAEARELNAQ